MGWLERNDFSQKLPVPLRNCSRTIDTHRVAVVRTNFYNYPCVLPLARVVPGLILDGDMIPGLERRQGLAASRELLTLLDMALGIG